MSDKDDEIRALRERIAELEQASDKPHVARMSAEKRADYNRMTAAEQADFDLMSEFLDSVHFDQEVNWRAAEHAHLGEEIEDDNAPDEYDDDDVD